MQLRYSLADLKQEGYFEVLRRQDVACTAHIHYSMEYLYVTAGSVILTTGDGERTVRQGEGTFLTSWQNHAYRTPGHSQAVILLFSPRLTPRFAARLRAFRPQREVVRPAADLMAWLLARLPAGEEADGPDDPIAGKALLYPLCADFLRDNPLTVRPPRREEMMQCALQYLGEHAGEPLTLTGTARQLGVNPAYLSQAFTAFTGMRFTECLNTFRVMRACDLLRETDLPVSAVAFEAGFGSLRTFNRVFMEKTGDTPRRFRGS